MRAWKIAALTLATVTVVSCSKSPTGRSQLAFLPEGQLNQMGEQSYEQMKAETPISDDPAMNAYVQCVSHALIDVLPEPYSQADWEITVFDQDTVNAFALPGNNIGVYRGLLDVAENQHQLAAVIGHEIGHVIAQHSNERVSSNMAVGAGLQIGAIFANKELESDTAALLMSALGVGAQVGILLPYSRTHESEADQLGLDYMADAGFKPIEAADLWRNMAKQSKGAPPELLSTHPSPQTRIDAIEDYAPSLSARVQQAHQQGRNPSCERPSS
ncbi:MAG: peptidase [Idiomarinaceae bacterium]|nr:peptidase [Idiomarinaceae bacterium]